MKPVPADAASRELILAAATELFAAQGFTGVTVKAIAGKAKVNPALLYYYFEDKEALYREVLAQIVGGMSRQIGSALASAPPSPEEGVRRFVMAQAERFFENRTFARLVLRELFDGGTVRLETPMHAVVTNAFRPLMELIKGGQRAGVFRADLDPRFAVISTVAQVAYFTLAQPIVAELMELPGGVPIETARAFGVHASDFVIRALKA